MYLGATIQLVGDKTGIAYCFTYSFRYLGVTVQLVVDKNGIYTALLGTYSSCA